MLNAMLMIRLTTTRDWLTRRLPRQCSAARSGLSCVVLALVMLTTGPVYAALSAQEILGNALDLHKGITDYIADVCVETDIPDLNMPVSRMTVYVKPPDKVHIESRSIVILPRDALLLGNLRRHLTEDTQVMLVGTDVSASPPVYCLKIVPKGNANRGRLLLWVAANTWTLTKSEIWAGPNKLATVLWKYTQVNKQFWMPTRLVCRLGDGTLPMLSAGTITLTFSNYRINTGLSDEFFAARESK